MYNFLRFMGRLGFRVGVSASYRYITQGLGLGRHGPVNSQMVICRTVLHTYRMAIYRTVLRITPVIFIL